MIKRLNYVERTQVISDVESGWARLTDPLKIVVAFRKFARIHNVSVCKQHKVVEHRDDVTAGLMDSKYHGAVVIAGKGSEGFHNIVCIVRVQTTSWLVKEQDRGARNEFASDRNATLLTTGDGPMTCQGG